MMKNIYAFLLILTLELVFNNYTSAQTGKWTQLFPLNSPPARDSHGMAYLTDNKILLFGGTNKFNNLLNDTWIYDLTENTWTEVNCVNKPSPRELFAMSQIDEGKVILFGGFCEYSLSNETWLFDINKMNWEKLNIFKVPREREGASFAYLGDNKMLMFSGHPWDGPENFIPDTWIYDNNKKEWDSIKYQDSYPLDRYLGMMTPLNNNSIILYGGFGNGDKGGTVNDTWIFDSFQGKWQILYPQKENLNRVSSSIARLQDNYCLVFGGDTRNNEKSTDEDQWSDDTWIYDGINNTWIELILENKPPRRYYHTMSNITNGKAILFGGIGKEELNDTWLFEFEPNNVIENQNENDILILNGFKGNNYLQIKNHLTENINIDLYNYLGCYIDKIFDSKIESNNLIIQIPNNNYETGIFFIRISSDKFSITKKIIIIK